MAPGPVRTQPDAIGPAPSADARFTAVLASVPAPVGAAVTTVVVVVAWMAARSVSIGVAAGMVLVIGLVAVGAITIALRSVARRAELELDVEAHRVVALVDELTGLGNRKGIAADIEERLDRRRRDELVGVLMCDLDRLKVINDSLGHAAGDEVLRVVARRMTGLVRDNDLIGRFGGDEFVVVTSGLPTVRDLEILADRMVRTLREPIVLSDATAQVVSGSIGIAWVSGQDDASPGDLLRDADVAMYRAKRDGGDKYAVFDASLRAEAIKRLELEQELRRGIRDGQIEVHYQPIVDRRSGEVDRFEALIRWDHPTRGTVHPAEFLPVAAESLLIVDLGRLVLEEACRQAVSWTELAGRPISIAVNIGERQLLDRSMVETVSAVLAQTGLAPSQLELEISEELIMERIDRSIVVLRQLDLLGVALAIDDFGTSQASLARLKELAMVSTLKIDRAFVEGIAEDEVDRKIVAAVVALADSIGMSVVAEGAESEVQARILGELGVNFLQGFLFRRPAPAGEFSDLVADRVHDRPGMVN